MPVIFRLFGMLTAIYLNNQLPFHTDKVHDIAPHGFLSLEFQSHETMCSQVMPETLFRCRLVGAECLGIDEHFFSVHGPSPLAPLPQVGEGSSLSANESPHFPRHTLSQTL